MRVLVIGATGMIGEALVRKLAERGHRIVLGVRNIERARARWPDHETIHVDYANVDCSDGSCDARLAAHLGGIDAIVNAVGIFREQGKQTFDALHVKGPEVLFRAAATAGVRFIVQISALGARADSDAGYLASKGRADDTLRKSAVPHTVVQPSLVFAPHGRSTRWFAMLAALPLTPLPGGGKQRIQPLHLDDLCDAIANLLDSEGAPARVEAVGAEPLSLRDYLAYFRRSLRLPGFFVAIPMAWTRMAARLLASIPGSLATPEALRMLEAGNVGDCRTMSALLGRTPRPVDRFIGNHEREAMRVRAQLDWLLPLLRVAVAAMWIATGWISAFVYPVESSLALLARVGLHGPVALAALYGAAALDVVLGVAVFFARVRRLAYCVQIALIAFYTLVITAWLPEYWAHPYGPVLKNIPLLVAIAVLHQLDDGRGHPDR